MFCETVKFYVENLGCKISVDTFELVTLLLTESPLRSVISATGDSSGRL